MVIEIEIPQPYADQLMEQATIWEVSVEEIVEEAIRSYMERNA